MPESTTMKPCYVFGPWRQCALDERYQVTLMVRDAPNPSERAEVWLYTKEDDGTPVSSDVAGWYGCFGAMADSVRLGPPHPIMTAVGAMASLDQMIREAGHLFAEDVERMRQMNALLLARVVELTPPTNPATSTPTRRATDTDSPIGDDRAPDRYMASGRETIDEVRDVCRHLATIWTIGTDNHDDRKLGDSLFALHCMLTAYVYRSRAGRKGDAKQDHAKAGWYIQMARHVASNNMDEEGLASSLNAGRNYDDPRASRCDYKPYEEPMTGSRHVLADLTAKFSPYELGCIMVPIVNPTTTR